MKQYKRKTVNFIGRITSTRQSKDFNINEVFYTIKIQTTEQELSQIKVFQRKVAKDIWETISNNQCLNKEYLFTCEKVIKTYHLIDWKRITENKQSNN